MEERIRYRDLSGPMKFAAVGGFVNMLMITAYAVLFLLGMIWGFITLL